MILEKLLIIELEIEDNVNNELKRIKAIKSIKNLLSQIDFSVELVLIKGKDRLIEILYSLKGKQLNKYEINIIEKIVEKF